MITQQAGHHVDVWDVRGAQPPTCRKHLPGTSSMPAVFDCTDHICIFDATICSMDKLFDLMTMGLKYQLLCATSLDQMLKVRD